MGHTRAEVESLIEARSGAVYEVLADYTTHHPEIMPAPLFSRIQVESGGIGEGTIFHITLRIAGREQRMHMRVAEPEPGRVLTETNLDTGAVTEFSLSSVNGDSPTLIRISSEWETADGVRGLFDKTATPILTRWILRKQLRKLNRYMQSQGAPK